MTPPLRPFLRSAATALVGRTYQYSTLKIPLREQGSQFGRRQLTEGDAACGSTVTDTDLGPPPPTENPRTPPGGHSWQACHFDRKHTDVSPEGKEGCICTSTSVTWLPAKQHLKSL